MITKAIFTTIAILLLALPVWAGGVMMMGGGATAGVVNGSVGSITHTTATTTGSGDQYYYFSTYTTTTAGTVRYGHAYIGDSNGNTVYIQLHSAAGARLLCCSGTIADNTAGWVNCDAGSDYTIAGSTSYIMGVTGGMATTGRSSAGEIDYYSTNWKPLCSDSIGTVTSQGVHTYAGAITVIWNNTAGSPE